MSASLQSGRTVLDYMAGLTSHEIQSPTEQQQPSTPRALQCAVHHCLRRKRQQQTTSLASAK